MVTDFFFNGRLSLIQQKMSVKQRLSWLPPSLSSFLGLAISCSVLFLGCKLNNLILNVCSLSPVSSDLRLWGLKKPDHCMFFFPFPAWTGQIHVPQVKGLITGSWISYPSLWFLACQMGQDSTVVKRLLKPKQQHFKIISPSLINFIALRKGSCGPFTSSSL